MREKTKTLSFDEANKLKFIGENKAEQLIIHLMVCWYLIFQPKSPDSPNSQKILKCLSCEVKDIYKNVTSERNFQEERKKGNINAFHSTPFI